MSNKLFPEAEIMLNERPTKTTAEQDKQFYQDAATEILQNGYSKSPIDKIIYDFTGLTIINKTGYEIAKALEEKGTATYDFSILFIEFLDCLGSDYQDLIKENVAIWVKAFNITPKFELDQALVENKKLFYGRQIGTTVYVTGYNRKLGLYYIHEDARRGGGYMIPYEKVESYCSPLKK